MFNFDALTVVCDCVNTLSLRPRLVSIYVNETVFQGMQAAITPEVTVRYEVAGSGPQFVSPGGAQSVTVHCLHNGVRMYEVFYAL